MRELNIILSKMTILCHNDDTMSEINKNLASNLDYLRKARGLTQSQLAQISGLPRTTISYVESGLGNPSLKTLEKLAAALGIQYEELLSSPKPACILVRRHELKEQARSQGQASKIELLPKPVPGLQFELLELKAQALMIGTPHMKGTCEYFTCIKGALKITVDGEEYSLEEGDILAFPGDRKHTYKNQWDSLSAGISIVILHTGN